MDTTENSRQPAKIQALIFDFDGLILDTEAPDYESWEEIYQEHGCSLPRETWAACIGTASGSFSPYDYLETQVLRPLARDEIRSRRRDRYHQMVHSQPVLPGVAEYIADARRLGLKLAVATSSDGDWAAGHLARLGLDAHFECIRCAEDVSQVKPHPELYLAVLDILKLRPDEAIALEDSPNGIRAAVAAGIFCVAVPNPMTCNLALDEAHLRLESLADLPLPELIRLAERSQ